MLEALRLPSMRHMHPCGAGSHRGGLDLPGLQRGAPTGRATQTARRGSVKLRLRDLKEGAALPIKPEVMEGHPFHRCLAIVDHIMKLEEAAEFCAPVDTSEHTDYLSFVDTPMDLGTIRSRCARGPPLSPDAYKTVQDFMKDMQLVWTNCRKYNEDGSNIIHDCNLVEQEFRRLTSASGLLTMAGGGLAPAAGPGTASRKRKAASPPQRPDSGQRGPSRPSAVPQAGRGGRTRFISLNGGQEGRGGSARDTTGQAKQGRIWEDRAMARALKQ
eukprot:jgi/Botrbrau1/21650/Bobra.43_1s0051.1